MQNHFIIGVDEVGRGPLLGDVVISAVCFSNNILTSKTDIYEADEVDIIPNHALSALTDSKKLSEKKRNLLFPIIQQQATAYSIIKIPPSKIDEINILQATLLGMKMAIEQTIEKLLLIDNQAKFSIFVDGNKLPNLDNAIILEKIYRFQAVIQGDSKHACISGASVLAKVVRDRDVVTMDKQYPQYGLAKHKGYPTAVHLQAIEKYGVLPEHRRSFAPIKHHLHKNN